MASPWARYHLEKYNFKHKQITYNESSVFEGSKHKTVLYLIITYFTLLVGMECEGKYLISKFNYTTDICFCTLKFT